MHAWNRPLSKSRATYDTESPTSLIQYRQTPLASSPATPFLVPPILQ